MVPPQGRGDVPPRRPPAVPGHGAAPAARRRADPARGLPARTPPARRKAASATEPTGGTRSGSWTSRSSRPLPADLAHRRVPGLLVEVRAPRHVSPTANRHDAITAIELALADHEHPFGRAGRGVHQRRRRQRHPALTVVTDNGGPIRSFQFGEFITAHLELRHMRTPGRNGTRERGFGSLTYEHLFLEEIDDVLALVSHAEDSRAEDRTVRPHEAIAWYRPREVHLDLANPCSPTLPNSKTCQLLDAGQRPPARPAARCALSAPALLARSATASTASAPHDHLTRHQPGSRTVRYTPPSQSRQTTNGTRH